MTNPNLPWVESPFFEELLLQQQGLGEDDLKMLRHYHEYGFTSFSGLLEEKLIDEVKQELIRCYDTYYDPKKGRIANLWKHIAAIKNLAIHDNILDKLRLLYQREPIPFQTLNFRHGSQQLPHSDSIHFNSLPQRFLCGVWIALEDVDEKNGALFYYPGSHRWPVFDYSTVSTKLEVTSETDHQLYYRDHYEPFIKKMIEESGIQPKIFKAKKGDMIIWSANLIHGGLALEEKHRTRWSQVNHYFFEDCLYYDPKNSNSHMGEWGLVPAFNIRTGKQDWGSYNGQKVRRKITGGERFLISPYAHKDWRDLRFFFKRAYHKFFPG